MPRAGGFPAAARATVAEVNGLRLDDLAAALLQVRATTAGPATAGPGATGRPAT